MIGLIPCTDEHARASSFLVIIVGAVAWALLGRSFWSRIVEIGLGFDGAHKVPVQVSAIWYWRSKLFQCIQGSWSVCISGGSGLCLLIRALRQGLSGAVVGIGM